MEAFGSNASVQRVEMVNAQVSDALGQAWGGALKRNATLTVLNLESNSISTGGILALAEGLRNNVHLVRLAMHNNHIYDKGSAALGEALATGSEVLFSCADDRWVAVPLALEGELRASLDLLKRKPALARAK